MAIQVQMRGGTTAENNNFRGVSREITVDTDKNTLVVRDGKTIGGFPLAREDLSNLTEEGFANLEKFLSKLFSGIIIAAPLDSIYGYLKCDGAAVSREIFSTLFERIGIMFGEGDGTTTFNIPDYRGVFLRGLGGNSAENFTITQLDAIRNITGTWGSTDFHNNPGSGAVVRTGHGAQGGCEDWYKYSTFLFDASRVVPTAEENRPINKAVNWFIKY